MPTSIALGEYFEKFIKQQLAQGRYNNTSEVVRSALRLLEQQERVQALQFEELRKAIQAGIDSGKGKPAEEVVNRLKAKYQDPTDKK